MDKVFDQILSQEVSSTGNRYLVSPKTVSDLFTEGLYTLKIPNYQRPYSWSEKNIKDLFEDIYKLTQKENSSWFLGPIFTVRNVSESKCAELLDGQQRITTIQIILREATFLNLKWKNIVDFSNHKELKTSLKLIIDLCNRCLIRMNGTNVSAVFETEKDMNIHFKKYIVDFQDIESDCELNEKRKSFEEYTLLAKNNGSPTAKTILESINIVSVLLRKYFLTDTDVYTNIDNFIKFVEALCTKCWIIEIPLQSHNDSIQIFESLNNRGKKLTLVDKLRFKSIVKSTNENIEFIRNKWKYIYSGISYMIDNGYVKDEDDFYKVFFNSYNGGNFTKEDSFIKFYVDTYLENDSTIIRFVDETIRIVEFYKTLNSNLNSDNQFIKSFEPKKQSKVKAILQVLKNCIEISDNSRFYVFAIIRKYENIIENNYILIQAFWNIIREVFYEEIYKNKKSNEIRTLYMDNLKEVKNNNFLIKLDKLDFGKSILSILNNNNNNEAKFIISVYAYLYDTESLCSHSPGQYTYSQLDHLFPIKWQQHWKDKMYTKEDILNYLVILRQEKSLYFNNINWELLEIDIKGLDGFELESQKSIDDTLIQFIGNKWILHSGTNIRTSNKKFSIKKEEYQNQNWIKIPNNMDQLGINKYGNFDSKDILLRSIEIINSIISKINNSWDNT